jgi:hypothetical protein
MENDFKCIKMTLFPLQKSGKGRVRGLAAIDDMTWKQTMKEHKTMYFVNVIKDGHVFIAELFLFSSKLMFGKRPFKHLFVFVRFLFFHDGDGSVC